MVKPPCTFQSIWRMMDIHSRSGGPDPFSCTLTLEAKIWSSSPDPTTDEISEWDPTTQSVPPCALFHNFMDGGINSSDVLMEHGDLRP
jgi:hypothetical protein